MSQAIRIAVNGELQSIAQVGRALVLHVLAWLVVAVLAGMSAWWQGASASPCLPADP